MLYHLRHECSRLLYQRSVSCLFGHPREIARNENVLCDSGFVGGRPRRHHLLLSAELEVDQGHVWVLGELSGVVRGLVSGALIKVELLWHFGRLQDQSKSFDSVLIISADYALSEQSVSGNQRRAVSCQVSYGIGNSIRVSLWE